MSGIFPLQCSIVCTESRVKASSSEEHRSKYRYVDLDDIPRVHHSSLEQAQQLTGLHTLIILTHDHMLELIKLAQKESVQERELPKSSLGKRQLTAGSESSEDKNTCP